MGGVRSHLPMVPGIVCLVDSGSRRELPRLTHSLTYGDGHSAATTEGAARRNEHTRDPARSQPRNIDGHANAAPDREDGACHGLWPPGYAWLRPVASCAHISEATSRVASTEYMMHARQSQGRLASADCSLAEIQRS